MFANNPISVALSVRQARLRPVDSLTTEAQQIETQRVSEVEIQNVQKAARRLPSVLVLVLNLSAYKISSL